MVLCYIFIDIGECKFMFMELIKNECDKQANYCTTENGAVGYKSTGKNLLDPGATPASNAQFLLFLCAVFVTAQKKKSLNPLTRHITKM